MNTTSISLASGLCGAAAIMIIVVLAGAIPIEPSPAPESGFKDAAEYEQESKLVPAADLAQPLGQPPAPDFAIMQQRADRAAAIYQEFQDYVQHNDASKSQVDGPAAAYARELLPGDLSTDRMRDCNLCNAITAANGLFGSIADFNADARKIKAAGEKLIESVQTKDELYDATAKINSDLDNLELDFKAELRMRASSFIAGIESLERGSQSLIEIAAQEVEKTRDSSILAAEITISETRTALKEQASERLDQLESRHN